MFVEGPGPSTNIRSRFPLHPSLSAVDGASIEGEGEQLLASWKKQLLAHADLVFAQEREATADLARLAELEQIVGRLTMELEAAKKSLAALEPSLEEKREVIEMLKSDYPISLVRRFANRLPQQFLLQVGRSWNNL